MTSYKKIGQLKFAKQVIDFLADQREPVSGKEVARALDANYNTVMCYLATLDELRWARKIGGDYELGHEFALYWAKKKTQNESKIERIQRELAELEV